VSPSPVPAWQWPSMITVEAPLARAG
jgi:hypothetical protein